MNKISVAISKKHILLFLVFAILGTSPFWFGPSTIPYWAGGFFFLIGLLGFMSIKKIEFTQDRLSAHYYLLFKTTVFEREDIESITIGYMPNTISSMLGLMKRGEVIRIKGRSGKPITITSKTQDNYKNIVIFLEDYYGEKIISNL